MCFMFIMDYWKSQLNLKVDFLFQRFLVITEGEQMQLLKLQEKMLQV